MANFITSCRILFSIVMLFIPALSPAFYALYLSAGITDMIDGTVARKRNTVTDFGSKLDTVADFVFVAVSLIKVLTVIAVPLWLWVWVGIIAVIKVFNVASGFIVQKKFVAEHTVMNKVTGLLLFILPLTLSVIELKFSSVAVCIVATFSAIQEGHFIRSESNRAVRKEDKNGTK